MEAAQQLWCRFRSKLLEVARQKLGNTPIKFADEEDIAQCVFLSLWRGATTGRFDDIRNRDELWWLLLGITKRKTVDLIRREAAKKRGGGQIRSGTVAGGSGDETDYLTLDQLIGEDPTPDFLAMMAEEHHRLLSILRDDRLRSIAVSRLEGFSVSEIAIGLSVSTRSVERKLQMIRTAWTKELHDVRSGSSSL